MSTSTVLKQVAQVTLAYNAVYIGIILLQLGWKKVAFGKWKEKKAKNPDLKEKYNRYTDVNMLAVDRSLGNFIGKR